MSPLAPLLECVTIGQLEYRSTSTKYDIPSWWKKSAQMCWKGYSGSAGEVDGMAGWEGTLLLHMVHLLLVSAMSLYMLGQNSEIWARAVIPLVP